MATKKEVDEIRRTAQHLELRTHVAVRIIERELAAHGASRHPLIDALLDIRNALRAGDGG